MSATLDKLQYVLTDHIRRILRLFNRDVLVTIVVRDPRDPDGGLMIGNDEPEDVIAEIRRRTDPMRENEVVPGRVPP